MADVIEEAQQATLGLLPSGTAWRRCRFARQTLITHQEESPVHEDLVPLNRPAFPTRLLNALRLMYISSCNSISSSTLTASFWLH